MSPAVRFRLPWNSRKNTVGGGARISLEVPEDLYALARAYAERESVSVEEAFLALARRGYDHWLLEQKYGSSSERIGWDPMERYRVALHAFLDSKLRLREMYSDLQRLVLLLSSLVKELEDCNRILVGKGEKPIVSGEELRLYREALEEYAEKYVKNVGVEATDTSGLQEFVSDCERILEIVKRSLRVGDSGGSRA